MISVPYTHRKPYWRYRGGELYEVGKRPVNIENSIGSVIGVQVCMPKSKFIKAYLFGDVLGFPLGFSDLGAKGAEDLIYTGEFIPIPRVGAGIQF